MKTNAHSNWTISGDFKNEGLFRREDTFSHIGLKGRVSGNPLDIAQHLELEALGSVTSKA